MGGGYGTYLGWKPLNTMGFELRTPEKWSKTAQIRYAPSLCKCCVFQ